MVSHIVKKIILLLRGDCLGSMKTSEENQKLGQLLKA